MPKTTGKNPWRPRRCKNCKLTYVPPGKDKGNADRSIFCTTKCRVSYHRNGGMNMDRLREVLTRAIIKALKQDDDFIEAIADKLRVAQSPAPKRVLNMLDDLDEAERAARIKQRLSGTGPIGREAAQALVDSFSPGNR